MELSDIELIESLPIGIIVDSNIKNLDQFGYSLSLSGVDVETCVTLACVKEVIRFSPIKVIIAEDSFVGGTIEDLVKLSKSSEKYFKVLLWVDSKESMSVETQNKKGVYGLLIRTQPFEETLKIIKKSIEKK